MFIRSRNFVFLERQLCSIRKGALAILPQGVLEWVSEEADSNGDERWIGLDWMELGLTMFRPRTLLLGGLPYTCPWSPGEFKRCYIVFPLSRIDSDEGEYTQHLNGCSL